MSGWLCRIGRFFFFCFFFSLWFGLVFGVEGEAGKGESGCVWRDWVLMRCEQDARA